MDVKWVAARYCTETKCPCDVAKDNDRDQGDRVPVFTEECYSQEHVVKTVIVAVTLDADPLFFK